MSGAGFDNTTVFKFNGSSCSDLVIVSATAATCKSPFLLAANPVTVSAWKSDVQVTSTFEYSYTAPLPSVSMTSASPTVFDLTGTGTITIIGTGFASDALVTVDNATCSNVIATGSTQLTCRVPTGTVGEKELKVIVPSNENGRATSRINYVATLKPIVSTVMPAAGPSAGGTSITIAGANFSSSSTVTIGGQACLNVSVTSGSALTCTTPAGVPGDNAVVVSNSYGAGAAKVFQYQLTVPTVATVSPATGSALGGTSIVLTGTNFTATTNVTVAGVACTAVIVTGSTSITCTTPAGNAGEAVIRVTNSVGTSDAKVFTYTAVGPTISSAAPVVFDLTGKSTITINGTNFALGALVTVDNATCKNVVVLSSTQLTCQVPTGTVGEKELKVRIPSAGNLQATSRINYVASLKSTKTFRLGFEIGDAAMVKKNAASLKKYLSNSTQGDLTYFRISKISGMASTKALFDSTVAKLLTTAKASSLYSSMKVSYSPKISPTIDKVYHPAVSPFKKTAITLYFEYK